MSTAALQHKRDLFWRSLIALPILVALGYQFYEAHRFAGMRLGIVVPTEVSGEERVVVEELAVNGPADVAGIRRGDVIEAVDGTMIADPGHFKQITRGFRDGVSIQVQVRRGDGEVLNRDVIPGMGADWAPFVVKGIVAFLYLAMALMTIDKRPGSMPSRLLYRLFILLAIELAMPGLEFAPAWLASLGSVLEDLLNGAQFGTEIHLISLIPRRPKLLRRRPWLIPLFYITGFLVSLTVVVAQIFEDWLHSDLLPWTYMAVAPLVYNYWAMIWALLIVAILLARMLRYPTARGRQLAGVVLCGLLPWALYIWVSNLSRWNGYTLSLMADGYLHLFALAPYPMSIFVMLRLEDSARNQVLRNLIEEVQEAGSIEKVAHLISKKLNLAFYTKCNYVFFRETRSSEFTSSQSSGSDFITERIPSEYKILDIADKKSGVLAYPGDISETLPAVEQEWLDNLQASLVVPIVESEGHMMGLLILGQKRSEEPYTPADLELLHALARQIAVAHENLALQLQVQERERVQRQVLDRLEGTELAIVKECPSCGFCYDTADQTCPRDGHQLTLTLPVERLIDGHYRLEQVLGRGGAAVVYLATDVRLNRGVAVKVLALSLLDDVVAPRRFEREARVSAKLLHPNIVTTHDFGKTKNGLPYIVMEHLEGKTLRQVLKSSGPLDPNQAAAWFGQVLDGLGAAHALGVVHRDLKPDNIFIVRGVLDDEEDVVKLLDFGLAKIPLQNQDEHFTSPGTIMGTLSYMAPEQLSAHEVDRRTDLYSVGVMACEAMTGRRPFEGRNPAQILTSIMQGKFQFPDDPRASTLRRVLEHCFEQKPSRRPGSIAELREQLIPALATFPKRSVSV